MRVTLNDFKEKIMLKKYVSKILHNGDTQRKLKRLTSVWCAIKSLPLQQAVQSVCLGEVMDGRLRLSQAYSVFFQENPPSFDVVVWKEKSFHRMSAIQEDEKYWRCIVACFEDKEF